MTSEQASLYASSDDGRVRIVVWNMSYWQKSDSERIAAWGWLRDFGADVALVQEAVPPAGLRAVVYRPIGGRRPWGSAVVGLTTEVVQVTQAVGRYSSGPVNLLVTHPGAVAIATVETAGRLITLVSMYGLIDDGYADTTVNRLLSDLVPLFDDPRLGCHVIVGGDLNITTQWTGRQARYRDWEAATLNRITSFGLRDCLDLGRQSGPLEGCGCADGDLCRHVRTQHHLRSDRCWQNDYLFASDGLVEQGLVRGAQVVDDPALKVLSDHMPLVVEVVG